MSDHETRSSMEEQWCVLGGKFLTFELAGEEYGLEILRVREIIGRVGKPTQGAQRLLAQIGFAYSGRVDPFDGGPHYEAEIGELTPILDGREYLPVVRELSTETLGAIVSYECPATGFRAVWSAVEPVAGAFDDQGNLTQVRVRQNVLDHLGMSDDGESKLHVALRPERRLAEMPTRAAGG